MSSVQQAWSVPEPEPCVAPSDGASLDQWFAVQTHARHEKVVAQRLSDRGVISFLPLARVLHRWSDRRKIVELPLFGCYVFAKLPGSKPQRLRMLAVDGVLRFVGAGGHGVPIPDEQIEAVRKLVTEELPCSPYPFLKNGQRVRVRGGALDGIEGILISQNADRTLVIAIDAIQRSMAVRIEGYDLEPV